MKITQAPVQTVACPNCNAKPGHRCTPSGTLPGQLRASTGEHRKPGCRTTPCRAEPCGCRPQRAVAAYLRSMTHATEAPAETGGAQPAWLENAPTDLKPVLQIGFEKYGDDPGAIAAWIRRLHDYRQFWNLVEDQPDHLEERYGRDAALQAQITEARAHPERRVPRPARRTA